MTDLERYIYLPEIGQLNKRIGALVNETRELLSSAESYINHHNRYTSYCLSLLHYCSPLRPVNDPLVLQQIDLKRGIALIDDKGTSVNTTRILILPTMVINQIISYQKHLDLLSRKLEMDRERPLALKIHRSLKGETDNPLPLFFYISEDKKQAMKVTPVKWKNEIDHILPFPGNMGRKLFATFCDEKGVEVAVRMGLGHSKAGRGPLDYTSIHSIREIVLTARVTMDEYIKQLGFELLQGLPHQGIAVRDHELIDDIEIKRSEDLKVWNFNQRLTKRQEKNKKIGDLVKVIIERLPALPAQNAKQDVINEYLTVVQNELISTAREEKVPLYVLRNRLNHWIQKSANKSLKNTRLPRSAIIDLDPTPIRDDFLEKLRCYEQVSLRFKSYLDRKLEITESKLPGINENKPASIEIRLAEIMVSGALHSYIFDSEILESLPDQIVNHTWRLGDIVGVDIHKQTKGRKVAFDNKWSQAPGSRWYPDPLSRALIAGLKITWPIERIMQYDKGTIEKFLVDLVRLLSDTKISHFKDAVCFLADLAECVSMYKTKGFVRSHWSRQILTAPLPVTTLVRVYRNEPLVNDTDSQCITDTKAVIACQIRLSTSPTTTRKKARQVQHDIKNVISDIEKNKEPKGIRSKSAYLKQQLAEKLVKIVSVNNDIPDIMTLVIGWGIHLCQFGTRQHPNLKFSTVKTYLRLIARSFAEFAPESELIAVTAEEYRDFYLKILNFGIDPVDRELLIEIEDQTSDRNLNKNTNKKRRYLYGRIQEFHAYLVDQWGAEDADWAGIGREANLGLAEISIDANVISHTEYQRALSLLECAEVPEHHQLLASVLLLLGYRFGLRFSEAYTLQERDIQWDEDYGELLVVVRPHVHGETKSLSGSRITPCLGQLDERESRILHRVIDGALIKSGGDDQSALMLEQNTNNRKLVDRSRLALLCGEALRRATGDPGIRYHNLRHTYVTRATLYSYPDKKSKEIKWQRNILCKDLEDYAIPNWQDNNQNLWLKSISQSTGHSAIETTLTYYTHCLDSLITGSYPSADDLKLSIDGTAYVRCVSRNYAASTLSSSLSRQKENRKQYKLGKLGYKERAALIKPIVKTLPFQDKIKKWNPHASGIYDEPLTPLQILRVLKQLGNPEVTTSQIAERLFIEEKHVQAIYEKGIVFEQEAGLDLFHLHTRELDPLLTLSQPTANFTGKQTNRSDNLIINLVQQVLILRENDESATQIIEKGHASWMQAFHAGREPLRFSRVSDINAFIKLLEVLEIRSEIEIVTVKNVKDIQSLFENILRDLKFTKINRLPAGRHKLKLLREPSIALRPRMSYHRQTVTTARIGISLFIADICWYSLNYRK